jgi:hypothetical protein
VGSVKVSSYFYVPIFPIKISLGKDLPVGPGGCLSNSGSVGVGSETHGKTIFIAFFAVRYYALKLVIAYANLPRRGNVCAQIRKNRSPCYHP